MSKSWVSICSTNMYAFLSCKPPRLVQADFWRLPPPQVMPTSANWFHVSKSCGDNRHQELLCCCFQIHCLPSCCGLRGLREHRPFLLSTQLMGSTCGPHTPSLGSGCNPATWHQMSGAQMFRTSSLAGQSSQFQRIEFQFPEGTVYLTLQ